jgi:hypothetical protein
LIAIIMPNNENYLGERQNIFCAPLERGSKPAKEAKHSPAHGLCFMHEERVYSFAIISPARSDL